MTITQENVLDGMKRLMEVEISYEPGTPAEIAFKQQILRNGYPYTMAYDFFRELDNGFTSRSQMSALFRELFGEDHYTEACTVADFAIGLNIIKGYNV